MAVSPRVVSSSRGQRPAPGTDYMGYESLRRFDETGKGWVQCTTGRSGLRGSHQSSLGEKEVQDVVISELSIAVQTGSLPPVRG